eukprot:TRINITY_DN6879_c0_g1_i6.p2 TRINITY_DN6879_c0_g1~~TRINITY_DN6879_c0_g1_i6.p2  ORF type:complete len:128 (+),score=22.20 TRINITY_DN6879_c0_g1_i6:1192-1575(+)
MDYVPLVENFYNKKVGSIELRIQTINEFRKTCMFSILEFDTTSFKMVSFMMDAGGLQTVVVVQFDKDFPNNPPVLRLQSMTYNVSKPPTRTVDGYPWSPRWQPPEMVSRIIKHLSLLLEPRKIPIFS